jgi:hypothetical protein
LQVDFSVTEDNSLDQLELLTSFQKSRESRCKYHLAKAEILKIKSPLDEVIKDFEVSICLATEAKNHWMKGLIFERYAAFLTSKCIIL